MEPFLGLVGSCLGPNISEEVKRQINYLCGFDNNVLDLEKEAAELEAARYELQEKVNAATNNGDIVFPRVRTWLEKVSEIQRNKHEFDDEIATARNSSEGSRYSLSKRAVEMAEAMKKLRQESHNFTTVAHPPPPEAIARSNKRPRIEFDTRRRVEDEVMSSLRDEGTNVVGICGMGGVGKTTMAKKIMHGAGEELGFEETVMAVVSQNVDKFKIQVDVAEQLGLTLNTEGNISSNAHKLRTRLSAGARKTLVVIDDIWEKLDLEEMGIPCSNTCKVLITSRNSHTLEAMDVEKLHAVGVLSKTEAWELFKSKAGSCIEQQNVVVVARQVVNECKGLPLALVTVGVALKNKESTPLWKTVLQQLKSANPSHMPELIQEVYQPFKLSYESLESEVQKSLFLLCCIFREDVNIPVKMLAYLCMGLQVYRDITSLEQARDTTCFLVERLKSRFLLLEGKNENHVKMHDVVRDVAIFIAAEEKRIKCNECTWISPNIGERIGAHGGSSLFPNLHLLWIDRESRDKELEIHNDFFGGMREIKVIMIRSLQRLPETIGLLKNLRTLDLEGCESLESISVVGDLSNLEILIFRSCETIESLPVEIGRLRQLRLLELSGCRKLRRIAPGIISNLIELEELIVEVFDGWEARVVVEGERKNAALCELEHLPKLTRLNIVIRDNGLAAESFHLSTNLLTFHITIGGFSNDHRSSSFLLSPWYLMSTLYLMRSLFEKKIQLVMSANISWWGFLEECVGNVEHMYIRGDGSSVLDLRLALNLRRLEIGECSKVEKLITNCPLLERMYLDNVSELEEIRLENQHNLASNFNHLSSIMIGRCGRLCSLFPSLGSGDCFPHLEQLEIVRCEMMEQVFKWNEDQNDHIPKLVVFPKLKRLRLERLRNLTCFIKGMQDIEFPQLAQLRIWGCPALKELVYSGSSAHHQGVDNDYLHLYCDPYKVTFGNLSKLYICYARNLCLQAPIDSFSGLSELEVLGVEGVNRLFSFSMTESSSCLPQLEKLSIGWCDTMEEVVLFNEEEENHMDIPIITLFPNLKELHLTDLPRLRSLSKGIENIIFHLPPKMSIDNCPLLESCGSEIGHENDDFIHLFCKPHHHDKQVEFDRLKDLSITGFWDDKMRRNWCPRISMIELFRGICRLSVRGLKGMESLFPCSIAQMMPNIKHLGIYKCKEMVRVIEDRDDACETTPPIILLFPKLESLSLDDLPKLGSFCEWRCGIQLPSLLNLEVTKCDMMKELTTGPLYTPQLQTFRNDYHKINVKDVISSTPLQLSSLRLKAEERKSIRHIAIDIASSIMPSIMKELELARSKLETRDEECKELISENNSAETKEGRQEIKEGRHSRIESSMSNVSRKRTRPPLKDESDSGEKESSNFAFEFAKPSNVEGDVEDQHGRRHQHYSRQHNRSKRQKQTTRIDHSIR